MKRRAFWQRRRWATQQVESSANGRGPGVKRLVSMARTFSQTICEEEIYSQKDDYLELWSSAGRISTCCSFRCHSSSSWRVSWQERVSVLCRNRLKYSMAAATDKEWPIMNPPCRHLLAFFRKSNALLGVSTFRQYLALRLNFKSLYCPRKQKTESWKKWKAVRTFHGRRCRPLDKFMRTSFSRWIMSHHVNDWRLWNLNLSTPHTQNMQKWS